MEYKNKLILVEKPRKNVALITLSNPPLNLVTLDLSAELRETLFKLEQDDEVRVIVLTGSGQRAFCVGSDVKEFPQVWDDVIGKKLQKENETFNCIEFLEKPVIAAMEGTVCGGGYEMAMACDLRIMSDISKIAQPEINLGVFPGSGGLFRLPRIVGAAKAIVTLCWLTCVSQQSKSFENPRNQPIVAAFISQILKKLIRKSLWCPRAQNRIHYSFKVLGAY